MKEIDQHSLERCRSLLGRARGYLDDAALLISAGSFASAVNRCYYSAHAAARALLALRGVEPETHEGMIGRVQAEFIGPGALPGDSGEVLRTLLSRRIDADYGDGIVGVSTAEDSLELARGFLDRARELAGMRPPP